MLERLEKSGVQGDCGPKLNTKETAEYWFAKAEKDGNDRAAAQARQREAEGRDDRLRHADQVVAGDAAEAGGSEVSALHVSAAASITTKGRGAIPMPFLRWRHDEATKRLGAIPLFLSRPLRAMRSNPTIGNRRVAEELDCFVASLLAMTAAVRYSAASAVPASGNPCSPWRRRRRTSPCPARSAARPSSAARPDRDWR